MRPSEFKPMKPAPKIRQKRCKVCKEYFTSRSSFAKACGPECAQEYVKQEKAKKERQERQKGLQALKTKRDYIKEAQVAFNAFIRARDSDKPCICCGRPLKTEAIGGGYDCGHYRSVGSAPHLRFNEDNAHGQTKLCNRYGAGRAVDYRIGLIARIGLSRVERLESDNSMAKWTMEELRAIRDLYRRKANELKKLIGERE